MICFYKKLKIEKIVFSLFQCSVTIRGQIFIKVFGIESGQKELLRQDNNLNSDFWTQVRKSELLSQKFVSH